MCGLGHGLQAHVAARRILDIIVQAYRKGIIKDGELIELTDDWK